MEFRPCKAAYGEENKAIYKCAYFDYHGVCYLRGISGRYFLLQNRLV